MSMIGSSSSSSRGGGRVVGDYIFGHQIGSGSFSVVWQATHRIRGTEVAVKEIAMERLSKKLRDSLLSEIFILRKINHPNIITLHEILQASGKIFLILEYCRGGDLSIYLRHRGQVPEATAKHFMQQLASGLQVLRDNNLIHRDLKPQNLLLSKNDETAILKIADFGFARSLQPMGLAETLCGSPLYMAPEIMQLQKYDAKADLWSVGAILFQLVTGKTPFTGNSQMQLLQNIIKSTELPFPRGNNDLSVDCIDLCQKLLRRNPVERLTFEEFFNHSFLLPSYPHGSCSPRSRTLDRPNLTPSSAVLSLEDNLVEELPFTLDDSGPDVPMAVKKPLIRPTYGFSVDVGTDKKSDGDIPSDKMDKFYRYSSKNKVESTDYKICWENPLRENIKESKSYNEQKRSISEEPAVVDSLEFDQDYVLVHGPPFEVSSSSQSLSRQHNSSCESESSSPPKNCAYTAPMPIIGGGTGNRCAMGSPEKYHHSPHSGASQGSMDMGDAMERPSSHSTTRIKSLQQYASAVTELVKEKVNLGKPLEAFSVQLVILAIWKQALHICHAQAASALEGSPSQDTKLQGSVDRKEAFDSRECISSTESQQPDPSQIERAFLLEVETADSLAKHLDVPDNTEMPDAMEIIFQSALSLGRKGGVDELMDNADRANELYSKAVRLLNFILVEAPSLILNPPFSLTYSDKMRLRSYIDHLKNRVSQYRSQRELLKGDDQ